MKKPFLLLLIFMSVLNIGAVSLVQSGSPAYARTLTPLKAGSRHVLSQASMKATTSGNLQYWGGNVLLHPSVYLTYWNWSGDSAGEGPYLESFFRGVGESRWLNTVTQYHDTGGNFISNAPNQFGGSWSDTTPIPAHPTRAQMAQEAVNTAAHFGNPVDAVYFIATPQGHSSVDTQNTGELCSLHYYGTVNPGSYIPVVDFPYTTDRTDCGNTASLDKVSINVGHEYAEAITDPLTNPQNPGSVAWSATGALNAEIGDQCQGTYGVVQLATGSFAVQSLWDNSAGGCVQSHYGSTALTVDPDFFLPSECAPGYYCKVTLTATSPASQGNVYWTANYGGSHPHNGTLLPGQSIQINLGPLGSAEVIITFSAPQSAAAAVDWSGYCTYHCP